MQSRADFTIEELKKDHTVLSLVCHPVSKLNLIATTIFTDSGNTSGRFLEEFSSGDVYAMGETIQDAALEIETVVGIAEDQGHELWHENKRLKGTLETLQAENADLKIELERYRLEEYAGTDIIRIDDRRCVEHG